MADCRSIFSQSAVNELIAEFGTPSLTLLLQQLKNPYQVLKKMRQTRSVSSNEKDTLLRHFAHGDLPYPAVLFCFDNQWQAFFKACKENTDLAFQFLPLAIASGSDQIVQQLLPTAQTPLASIPADKAFNFAKKLLKAVLSLPTDEVNKDWLASILAYAYLNIPKQRGAFNALLGFYSAQFNHQIGWNLYVHLLEKSDALPSMECAEMNYMIASASGNLTIINSAYDLLRSSFRTSQLSMIQAKIEIHSDLLGKNLPRLHLSAFMVAYEANQQESMRNFAKLLGRLTLTKDLLQQLIKIGSPEALGFCFNPANGVFKPETLGVSSNISIDEVQLAAAKSIRMLEMVRNFTFRKIDLDQTCFENTGLSGEIACFDAVLKELGDKAKFTPQLLQNACLSGNPRLVTHILNLANAKEMTLRIEDIVQSNGHEDAVSWANTAEMEHFLREYVEMHCKENTAEVIALRASLKMGVATHLKP